MHVMHDTTYDTSIVDSLRQVQATPYVLIQTHASYLIHFIQYRDGSGTQLLAVFMFTHKITCYNWDDQDTGVANGSGKAVVWTLELLS
jgi:hypothetical protein